MTKKPDPKHGITGCAIGTEDVAILMDYIIDQEPQKGLVHKNDTASEDQSVRDADVYFIDHAAERIYKLLNKIGNTVNKYFNYEISGIETAQVIHYRAPSNGYGYHIDLGPEEAANRKISASILLNDGYDGGEFCFRTGETGSCTRPGIGDVVAFSSFIPHKVNPITRGDRFVLVVWFTGPAFH